MQREQFQLNAELELRHWWFVARRQILHRLIAEVLPPDPTKTVLEVGCGTGGNLGTLADRYRCIGVDPAADAINYAQQRFPQVNFVRGEAPEDCRDDLQRASLVCLTDVLEHVPDDFHLLSQLLAATRPGCLFVLTVPAEPALWSQHDVSHAHYRRYLTDRLRRLWSEFPVDELLVSPFNSRLYPVIRAIRWCTQVAGCAVGKAGTDLSLPAPWVNDRLTRRFAGEQKHLLNVLHGQAQPYSRGVSLIAILRRGPGEIVPIMRPVDVAADEHQPQLSWEHRTPAAA